MSQQQPEKPEEPIKYGDVFPVQGELADKPVAPKDAAMMQMAENSIFGHTQKGCAAAAMESAAMKNENAGFVGYEDINAEDDVTIKETELPGKHIITESVGNEVSNALASLGYVGCHLDLTRISKPWLSKLDPKPSKP